MKILAASIRIEALALALALAGVSLPAAAAEQRCDELGASCVCSEPLNTGSYAPAGGNGWNPSDSTTKECNRGYPLWVQSDWSPASASGMGLPSAIQYVARRGPENASDSTYLGGTSGATTASTKRVCVRFYTRYSADYQAKNLPVCQANKFSEFSFGDSNALFHWDWAESGAERFTIINWDKDGNGSPEPSYNLARTGPLTIEDCRSQWCHVEMCASGNIKTGSGISAEGHVRGLSDGKRVDWNKTYIGSACPGGSCRGGDLTAVAIVNAYRQNTCAGSRYISHAMQAQWDTDAGQFIGPAYEVEGGGSTPPPPPPPPTGGTVGTGAICSQPSGAWTFCDGFESGSLSAWHDVSLGNTLGFVTTPVAAGSRALVANIPAGGIAGDGWAGRYFGDHPLGSTPTAANMEDVYFEGRVQFSGSYNTTYGKLFTMAAFESWSASYPQPMNWSPYYVLLQYNNLQAEGVLHSKTAGTSKWRNLLQNVGTPVTFQKGRWYELQYRLKLNSVGQSNGIFEMWIDGVKKASYTDVNYRDSYATHGWNHVMLTAYQNGAPPTAAQSLYWDEVVLSPVPITPTGSSIGAPGQPVLQTTSTP